MPTPTRRLLYSLAQQQGRVYRWLSLWPARRDLSPVPIQPVEESLQNAEGIAERAATSEPARARLGPDAGELASSHPPRVGRILQAKAPRPRNAIYVLCRPSQHRPAGLTRSEYLVHDFGTGGDDGT